MGTVYRLSKSCFDLDGRLVINKMTFREHVEDTTSLVNDESVINFEGNAQILSDTCSTSI